MTRVRGQGISERMGRLRDEIMKRKGSFPADVNPFTRDVALWRAMRLGRSRVQVRAALLHELVEAARIEVRPGWSLAGEHLLSCPGVTWGFASDAAPETLKRIAELGVPETEIESVRNSVRNWLASHSGTTSPYWAVGESSADLEKGRGGWAGERERTVYIALGWMENHSIRDYAKVLRTGFQGIRRRVEQCLSRADVSDPEFPQGESFWKAALDVCDAGVRLGQRYSQAAADLAKEAHDPEDRARLLRMSAACARVPARGARSFFEATQSLWLSHILTCGEDGINANSIGRLDQILFPWYQADVQAGHLTSDEAREIMEELACKLYLEYDVQAITLGGLDPEGQDASNDLSALILEATQNVGFVRDLSVRLHRNTPPALLRLTTELIARGGGIPFLFNDDCFVRALNDRGIGLKDARNYAPIGCIELTVPGRANPHAVSGWFNTAKCLELALFGGRDPRLHEPLGPSTGELPALASFDDLFAAYSRQVDFFARRMVYHCNRGELAQRERGPLPCWSVLTDDCIRRGRDITDCGAVYNYHSICLLGTANTADSLMVLKKLVFEEGRIAPKDLLAALAANYEGHESLRQLLLRQAPKYGNDCPDVDALARRVDEQFIALMDTMRSPLDGRYFVHLFSFVNHIAFGKSVGATPDGRRAGEPLAYSLSAHQGRDEKGITALIHSLARLPHDQAAGATAAIVEVDPIMLQGPDGIDRLTQLIRSAIAMGVGQLQWNVTTAERLRLAQQDPEKYGNIAVRVAGYSQMFKLINKELQDHIIARTKHQS